MNGSYGWIVKVSFIFDDVNTARIGSLTFYYWYVPVSLKDVNMFSTTVLFATTNERATINNGAMASSRIINWARSPEPVIYIKLKFSTDVEYEKIIIFEQVLRKFVRSRPREWICLGGFLATKILTDLGHVGKSGGRPV